MADKMRWFRTYHNGMPLTATVIRNPYGRYSVSVWTNIDGKKHPMFDNNYKDERGAVRALSTRFRGAEWEEFT